MKGMKRVAAPNRDTAAKELKNYWDYVDGDPKARITPDRLAHLHACIRFTQQNLQKESYAKMDEESPIHMPLPNSR